MPNSEKGKILKLRSKFVCITSSTISVHILNVYDVHCALYITRTSSSQINAFKVSDALVSDLYS